MATSGSVTGTVKTGGYLYLAWNNTNRNATARTSSIEQWLNFQLTGGTSSNATETGSLWINGSSQAFNNGTVARATNANFTLTSRTTNYTHDANGNLTITGLAGYFTSGWTYLGSFSVPDFTVYIDRLALAPTNIAPVGSLVAPTTARITAGVSSFGNGTSVTYNIRYRLSGATTWIERGYGGATWDLTGLKPGKTYEMGSRAKNNNGDEAGWTAGTYTFKTKGIAGLAPILMALTRG